MYHTAKGLVSDDQAAKINATNMEIWENFWKIPREKRTKEDWEKLLEIDILVKQHKEKLD